MVFSHDETLVKGKMMKKDTSICLGNSMNVDIADIEETRRFCNKIWQAYRFCVARWGDQYVPPKNHTNLKVSYIQT